MNFRIKGLPATPFLDLFRLCDAELASRNAVRRIADGPGYPCRISLTDAQPGQEVILVNYEHQPAPSPYRSSHAIYVREGERTYDEIDQVPQQLRQRQLSLRAFDAHGMLMSAEVIAGSDLESAIERGLAHADAQYLHAHYAAHGCYAALIERAGALTRR